MKTERNELFFLQLFTSALRFGSVAGRLYLYIHMYIGIEILLHISTDLYKDVSKEFVQYGYSLLGTSGAV